MRFHSIFGFTFIIYIEFYVFSSYTLFENKLTTIFFGSDYSTDVAETFFARLGILVL